MDVKDIIRSRRIELGMTMKELADKIGVSEATVSRWESGDIANMRRDKIAALSQVLDVDPAVIMGWEVKAAPKKSSYYLNPETEQIAQRIYEDKTLRALFDVAADATPADLQAAHLFLKALKEREQQG